MKRKPPVRHRVTRNGKTFWRGKGYGSKHMYGATTGAGLKEIQKRSAKKEQGPKINAEYERRRLINMGMPDVAAERYPILKSKKPNGNVVKKKRFSLGSEAKSFIKKMRKKGYHTTVEHHLGISNPHRIVYYSR